MEQLNADEPIERTEPEPQSTVPVEEAEDEKGLFLSVLAPMLFAFTILGLLAWTISLLPTAVLLYGGSTLLVICIVALLIYESKKCVRQLKLVWVDSRTGLRSEHIRFSAALILHTLSVVGGVSVFLGVALMAILNGRIGDLPNEGMGALLGLMILSALALYASAFVMGDSTERQLAAFEDAARLDQRPFFLLLRSFDEDGNASTARYTTDGEIPQEGIRHSWVASSPSHSRQWAERSAWEKHKNKSRTSNGLRFSFCRLWIVTGTAHSAPR